MSEIQRKEKLTGILPNGSLEEGTLKLFEDSGSKVLRVSRRHEALVQGPYVSRVKLARPFIIPRLVERGIYDFGICGTDCIAEAEADVVTLAELEYGRGGSLGRTKLVLIAAQGEKRTIQEMVQASPVLTEYPNLTRKEFAEMNIPIDIEFSHGSTEAHIPGDYAMGVCLSDSGESLKENKQEVLHVLFHSCTVLITNERAFWKKRSALSAFMHSLVGTLEARNSVFVFMNVPAKKKKWVLRQLPALKTPTVSKLAGRNFFSVATVMKTEEATSLMPWLLSNGVEGWVETPIKRVVQRW